MITKQQKHWISKLKTEQKRRKGSYYEWVSIPSFGITCCGCFIEYKTSDPEHAMTFIKEHSGHQLVFEWHVWPDNLQYDREETLERLALLGKYLVQENAPDLIIQKARTTYKFISHEEDIEGGLKNLMNVMLSTAQGKPMTTEFQRLWLKSIIYSDGKFIDRVTRWMKGKEDD